MKKQIPERQRRRATTRQRNEESDRTETFEEVRDREDVIDGIRSSGGSSGRGSSYDGSDSAYVGGFFVG